MHAYLWSNKFHSVVGTSHYTVDYTHCFFLVSFPVVVVCFLDLKNRILWFFSLVFRIKHPSLSVSHLKSAAFLQPCFLRLYWIWIRSLVLAGDLFISGNPRYLEVYHFSRKMDQTFEGNLPYPPLSLSGKQWSCWKQVNGQGSGKKYRREFQLLLQTTEED